MLQAKPLNDIGQFNALKIFKHLGRINDYRQGKIIFPISVDLSVSNFCNQKCVWCYYSDYLEKARVILNKECLYELVEELGGLGIKGINFTGGGEPLTHPAIIEVMEFAHSKGIDVGLITNGVLLNEDKIKRLVKISKFIRISLSSYMSKSYMKFHNTKEEDFLKLIENLKLLGRYAKEFECLTGILFLLESGTESELLDTVKLVRDSGLKFFEVRSIKNTAVFTPISLKQQYKDLIKKASKLEGEGFRILVRDEIFRRGKDFGKNYKICYIHEFVTSISAEGDVYLCCEFEGRKQYAFGNIKEKSFKDIWLSEKRKEIIKNLDLNKCFACCKGDGINLLFNAIDSSHHASFI